jgi:hypothetical protein
LETSTTVVFADQRKMGAFGSSGWIVKNVDKSLFQGIDCDNRKCVRMKYPAEGLAGVNIPVWLAGAV